jgi:hypothetical protein
MVATRSPELDALALEAVAVGDVRSAAIFVPTRDGGGLSLVGAAGIDGPALDGLVAAVQQPMHPVHRALTDAGPTFDVLPMNPGGPKLRSHLPVRALAGSGPAVAVLALAHDAPMSSSERDRLGAIAERVPACLPAT